jgi:hypothetical protein
MSQQTICESWIYLIFTVVISVSHRHMLYILSHTLAARPLFLPQSNNLSLDCFLISPPCRVMIYELYYINIWIVFLFFLYVALVGGNVLWDKWERTGWMCFDMLYFCFEWLYVRTDGFTLKTISVQGLFILIDSEFIWLLGMELQSGIFCFKHLVSATSAIIVLQPNSNKLLHLVIFL